MKAALLLVLAAVTAGELSAQTGLVSLVGAVRDSAGSPIAGAEVRLETGRPPVFTDSAGGFWIDSLSPGRWVLRFRKPGFEPMAVDFTVPEGPEGDVELDDVVFRPAALRVITLAGAVRDAITGRPIDGVHIRVGGDMKGFSDASGHFLQRVVVRGGALVDLARVGFRSLHFDLWPGEGQDTVKLAISLRPVAVELSEVVVEGASGFVAQPSDFERHRKAGFGTFLTPERIRTIASFSAADMLRWAGVQVNGDMFAEGGRSLRLFGAPYTCGVRGQGPIIFIDGRRWPSESALAYLDATNPSEIVGVEVYKHPGGVPVEYNGPDAACGVVAVWYRP